MTDKGITEYLETVLNDFMNSVDSTIDYSLETEYEYIEMISFLNAHRNIMRTMENCVRLRYQEKFGD